MEKTEGKQSGSGCITRTSQGVRVRWQSALLELLLQQAATTPNMRPEPRAKSLDSSVEGKR